MHTVTCCVHVYNNFKVHINILDTAAEFCLGVTGCCTGCCIVGQHCIDFRFHVTLRQNGRLSGTHITDKASGKIFFPLSFFLFPLPLLVCIPSVT